MAEHGESSGTIRELLAVFGFGVDTKELKEGESELNKFVERVKGIGEAVAAVFAVEKIYEFAEVNVKAMTEIEHAAARLGVAAESVQSYQYASKALGMESGQLLNMMGRLQVTQEQAAQGSKEAAHGFALVGIQISDLKGMSADQAFEEVAEGISKIQDPTKRAAAAVALFGRGGREILPFLAEGKEGIAALREEYKQLGGGYSEKAIEQSKQFEHESAKLSLTLTALKSKALEKLLPILSKLIDYSTSAAKWIYNLTKNSRILEVALGALGVAGTVFAVQMAIANAPLILLTAAIAGLLLLIEDFVVMMEGGDSEIGELIDSLFGKDEHLNVVQGIKDAWEGVKNAFKEMLPYVTKVFDFYKWALGNWDKIGQLNNWRQEKVENFKNAVVGAASPASTPFASGSLKKQAQAKVDAEARGETFTPNEIPKGLSKGEVEYYISGIARDLSPNVSNGDMVSRAPQNNYGVDVPLIGGDLNVSVVAPAGADGKAVGEHAAKVIRETLKQERRAALATRQRKTAE